MVIIKGWGILSPPGGGYNLRNLTNGGNLHLYGVKGALVFESWVIR